MAAKKSRVSMLASQGNLASKSRGALSLAALGPGSGKFTSRLGMRKSSFGYTGVPGVGRVADRSSMLAPEFKRPPLMYLNTYQLDPIKPFHAPSVLKAANEILDELFGDHRYNPQESPAIVLRISGDLMREVKAMNFNRYRIITAVTLAQKRAQSYNNAISFLWDNERDNYVNTHRETATALIQVTVFGIYLD